jgi:hypothetical protein
VAELLPQNAVFLVEVTSRDAWNESGHYLRTSGYNDIHSPSGCPRSR